MLTTKVVVALSLVTAVLHTIYKDCHVITSSFETSFRIIMFLMFMVMILLDNFL